MATTGTNQIDALAAPSDDVDVLVWPRDIALTTLAARNHAELSAADAMILDRPLHDWRLSARGEQPVVLAGHQPEFIHPGVWAKHPAVRELADRLGGVARFLLVDSDVPNTFVLAWPAWDDGRLRRAWAAPPGYTVGTAFEQLPAMPDDDWRAFFAAVPRDSATCLPDFIEAFAGGRDAGNLRTAAVSPNDGFSDYVSRWRRGMNAVEASLGVSTIDYVSVAGVFSGGDRLSAAALAFVAQFILTADRFATAYNTALQHYRQRRGIRGRQHPIPDLHIDADRIELPFWAVADGRPRLRLFVTRPKGSQIRLYASGEQGETTSQLSTAAEGVRSIGAIGMTELRDNPLAIAGALGADVAIRPRALALTMFARLLACDLFVHGIGGAKYDQITDDIIRMYFGISPPGFACVTATLRLPLKRYDVTQDDVLMARRRLRDLRYNPQRYVDASQNGRVASLLEARRSAIDAAASLRATAAHDRAARRQAFERIHQANRALLEVAPAVVTQAREQAERIDHQIAHNETAGSREWFYALQPRTNLRALVERVIAQVNAAPRS